MDGVSAKHGVGVRARTGVGVGARGGAGVRVYLFLKNAVLGSVLGLGLVSTLTLPLTLKQHSLKKKK